MNLIQYVLVLPPDLNLGRYISSAKTETDLHSASVWFLKKVNLVQRIFSAKRSAISTEVGEFLHSNGTAVLLKSMK